LCCGLLYATGFSTSTFNGNIILHGFPRQKAFTDVTAIEKLNIGAGLGTVLMAIWFYDVEPAL
jgi:hypothetical protein